MGQDMWVVGTDRDDELVAEFASEEAAISFANFDSQLTGRTAVVMRRAPGGTIVIVAEFAR